MNQENKKELCCGRASCLSSKTCCKKDINCVVHISPKEEIINDLEKEEWGGWKIISDMLDNPDENGIYNTSEAYKKLYDFVVEQKQKAISSTEKKVAKEIIGEIKKSFIEEFFKSGKRWYNFIFKDEEEKNDALKIVENEWKDIITKIKSKYEN